MLDEKSKKLRRMIVQTVVSGGRGHIGPAGSLVELLRVKPSGDFPMYVNSTSSFKEDISLSKNS